MGLPFYNSGVYNSGVYNSGVSNSGVYNGGGGNTITIDGYTYNFVQIGSLYWITENLIVKAPNAVTYNNGQLNEYGLYYQPVGDFPIIENKLNDGWRIPTKNDFLNLYSECGNNENDFIRDCFNEKYANAQNLKGLNLLMCGYHSSNSWYLDNQASLYWTKTIKSGTNYYDLYLRFNGQNVEVDGVFMEDSTSGTGNYRAPVRICKDV